MGTMKALLRGKIIGLSVSIKKKIRKLLNDLMMHHKFLEIKNKWITKTVDRERCNTDKGIKG